MEFNERDAWLVITAVMKTSERVKKLPKEYRDYLFLNLRRTYAPHLSDSDVRSIEKYIDGLAKNIQQALLKNVKKFLGKTDIKEAIKKLGEVTSKEDADLAKKLIDEKSL